MAADEPIEDLSGRVLGEFVLRARIDGGGHGVVYRCEQPLLKRDVVIKVLVDRRKCHDASRERFLREAQLASRLDHPYAAHVYAFGAEDDGLLWLAMELVQGVSLSRWLLNHGRMSIEQFEPFFKCVTQVVQVAHERGIIHRDLKPSNLMVLEHSGLLFPKLLDLGIAKGTPALVAPSAELLDAADPTDDGVDTTPLRVVVRPRRPVTKTGTPDDGRLTHTGARMGSAPYMSPEQWRDAHSVGPATDIYSLGVLIYEALTGRKPFQGPSLDEFYWQHIRGEVPALGEGFSAGLDRVVQRALSKSPADRQATVRELASELRAAHRAQPQAKLDSRAQVWDEHARPRNLLLRRAELLGAPKTGISELSSALLSASWRRVSRDTWLRRGLAAGTAAIAIIAVAHDGAVKTQAAEHHAEVAEAKVTQSELDQGRSALLHNEPDAATHLAVANQREPTRATEFMLARAREPRLAEKARLPTSFGRGWSATFSPDGTQIVETDDLNAQVWDAKTYQRRFLLPHGDEVFLGVYSADSKRLVTAARDAVRIWDTDTGTLIHKLIYPRQAGAPTDYFVAAISPDGRFVAAMNARGSLVDVWDAATGAPLAELPITGAEFPRLVFSADGRWLAATGGADARVFDTRTWRLAQTIRGPRIRRLAFDPTGSRLLTGAATGDVSVWAIPSGTRLQHLRDVGESVSDVAFSPDGQLIVAAMRDGAVNIWRVSGQPASLLSLRRGYVFAVEFDRTSQYVLITYSDGAIVVADVLQGMPIAVLEGPNTLLRAAHFDPRALRVVAAAMDGSARVWDANAQYLQFRSPSTADGCGIVTTSEPDRRFIAIGCAEHPTRVWDTAHDKLLAELPSVSRVEGDFTSAFPVVSADGDRAAIARGNTVEVYELPSRRLLNTIEHHAPVNAVAFSTTGRDIVSGAIDGSLLVTRDGALLVLPSAAGGIDAVSLLPDGRVVAADATRQLRIYDPRGPLVAALALPGRVMSLRADGDRLVTVPIAATSGGPPLLVDLEHGRVVCQLEGHSDRVFSARWVPHHQILTAGSDGTLRRWEGSTGKPLRIYRAGGTVFLDAAQTPDGWVVAGSGDGLVRFWDPGGDLVLWGLSAHKSWIIGIHPEGGDLVTHDFNGNLARWRLPIPAQTIDACNAHDDCAIVPR